MPRSKTRKAKKTRHRPPPKDSRRPAHTPLAEGGLVSADEVAKTTPPPRFPADPQSPRHSAGEPRALRDAAAVDELYHALLRAVDLLRNGHDPQLMRAFEEGRRVVLGLLKPWWRKIFQPSRATYLHALRPALNALNKELERRRSPERDLLERRAKAAPIASPCLTTDGCEKCGTRTERLLPIVEDCAIGPPLGLRLACATLCRNCSGTPFKNLFGPAEISRRIRTHSTH
ncbi:hypothetical protein [Amycolatopsis sp. cmx-11-51]|uniref:hypothetical protein n=1 Tax=unclassified Amycolatopsis TaxID=2618356 RepID=UPI0039E68E7C